MFFRFRHREVRERLIEASLAFLQGDELKIKNFATEIWRAAILTFSVTLLLIVLNLNLSLGAVPVLFWFLAAMVSFRSIENHR